MPPYRVRYIIQILAFIVLMYGGYFGLRFSNFMPSWTCTNPATPSSSCYLLPFQRLQGGVDPNSQVLRTMPFFVYFIIDKWRASLLFFGSLLFFIIVFNKIWCGWLCPAGSFQDGISFIRKKVQVKGVRFSEKAKGVIRPFKYFSLFLFFMTFAFMLGYKIFTPPFCKICPIKSFLMPFEGGLNNLSVGIPPGVGTSIFTCIFAGFILIMFIFRERFFCLLCPTSALMHIFHKFSLFKIKKNVSFCNSCSNCWRVCPIDIKEIYLQKETKDIIHEDCISCLKCIESCPKAGALHASYFKIPFFISSAKRIRKIISVKRVSGKDKKAIS